MSDEEPESAEEPGPLAATWFADYVAERARDAQLGRTTIAACCERLVALGVTEVRIAYDGYGDSGGVESIAALAGETDVELPEDLSGELSDAAALMLPMGWENEMGAYGELVLEVAARSLTLQHNWRVETYELDEETWQL